MSKDAIHNPSPATNAPTETTNEKIVEQPTMAEKPVTESPAATSKTLLVANAAGDPVQNTAGSSVQNTASYEPSYQTNRSTKRPAGRKSFTKMTREQLMAAIAQCAEALGHVPSHAELMRTGKVSGRQIVKHFGTYTRALRACNLERSTGGKKLPLEKLFLDWARVVRELKKIPSKADYEHLGKHSDTPLKSRFGSWSQVPRYLRRYMEEQGLTEEWKDVMELIREYEQGQDGMEMAGHPGV